MWHKFIPSHPLYPLNVYVNDVTTANTRDPMFEKHDVSKVSVFGHDKLEIVDIRDLYVRDMFVCCYTEFFLGAPDAVFAVQRRIYEYKHAHLVMGM